MDKKNQLNISVFSYNIFWKIMVEPSPLANSLGKEQIDMLKSNILTNILGVKNYYNPFFYCFQEAENNSLITKLFEPNQYDCYVGISKPEHILTIWQKKFFSAKLIIDGEFEPGRPFSIFVFKDLRFKIEFVLINIHAGHHHNTLETIFEPIQKSIDKNKKKFKKFDIKRILISGDFNRDIGSQIIAEPDKYTLKINLSTYKFFPFKSNNKTCCSLEGYGYNKNCDQIIDSMCEPILTHQLNKEPWYNPKSSDHVAILSVVKNFI